MVSDCLALDLLLHGGCFIGGCAAMLLWMASGKVEGVGVHGAC